MSVSNPESSRPDNAYRLFEQTQRQIRRSRRARRAAFSVLFLLAVGLSCILGEISIKNFLEGLPGIFNYMRDLTPEIHAHSVLRDVGEWYWGFGNWVKLLLDTVIMAFLGTLFGATGAFLICFPASRNLMRHTLIYALSRRLTELARAVPELVYAMIFVFSFGLGSFPGVLAIAIHSLGALGKLFSEVNENVDVRPIEGTRAAGANWFQIIRYAVIPQVLPSYVSYTLLRFEINVRAAAVIGFVGAGGIGQELMFVIRQFVYSDISAIVLLIILLVSLIDIACEQLRHLVIGKEALV